MDAEREAGLHLPSTERVLAATANTGAESTEAVERTATATATESTAAVNTVAANTVAAAVAVHIALDSAGTVVGSTEVGRKDTVVVGLGSSYRWAR